MLPQLVGASRPPRRGRGIPTTLTVCALAWLSGLGPACGSEKSASNQGGTLAGAAGAPGGGATSGAGSGGAATGGVTAGAAAGSLGIGGNGGATRAPMGAGGASASSGAAGASGGEGTTTAGGTNLAGAGGATAAGGGAGAAGTAAGGDAGAAGGTAVDDRTTVVLFLVDGVMLEAVRTAVASGASNLQFVLENGVRVETSHSPSPAAAIELPAGSPGGTLPWARATSGNVAVHTGCHLFESNQMDDIFLAARAAGIKSVFSGGDDNYAIFTTPDYHYGMRMDDALTVERAITHLRDDGARLLRIHLQRVRDSWRGPADKTDPSSAYIRQLVQVDGLLGTLMQALKTAGVWEQTYLVIAADHGMGASAASNHPASVRSSWEPFMAFYGPGLKRGSTIPYAELPDIAVTTAHFLGLQPLRGHLDPRVTLPVRGATGTLLRNLFVGAPAELEHPRYIEKCLALGPACMSTGDDYAAYRRTMLTLIQ